MLQIGAALFYYKLGQTLLQIGTSVVTNWGSYYKLGQPLLQIRAIVTNWGIIISNKDSHLITEDTQLK